MPYVKRESGKIVAASRWPHRDNPEFVPDDDAELRAFLEPPAPPRDARLDDGAGAVTRAEINALKAYLRGDPP